MYFHKFTDQEIDLARSYAERIARGHRDGSVCGLFEVEPGTAVYDWFRCERAEGSLKFFDGLLWYGFTSAAVSLRCVSCGGCIVITIPITRGEREQGKFGTETGTQAGIHHP